MTLRVRPFLSAVGRRLPDFATDVVAVAGAVLVAFGCWLIAPAAGFIVGGLELLAIAWLVGRDASD